MTPLQKETNEWAMRNNAEREAALKECRTEAKYDRCFDAYSDRFLKIQDAIRQRHGLPGMLWRKQ